MWRDRALTNGYRAQQASRHLLGGGPRPTYLRALPLLFPTRLRRDEGFSALPRLVGVRPAASRRSPIQFLTEKEDCMTIPGRAALLVMACASGASAEVILQDGFESGTLSASAPPS